MKILILLLLNATATTTYAFDSEPLSSQTNQSHHDELSTSTYCNGAYKVVNCIQNNTLRKGKIIVS